MRNQVFPVANTTPMSVDPRRAKQPSPPYVVLCELAPTTMPPGRAKPAIDDHLVADALREQIGDRMLDAELADDPGAAPQQQPCWPA